MLVHVVCIQGILVFAPLTTNLPIFFNIRAMIALFCTLFHRDLLSITGGDLHRSSTPLDPGFSNWQEWPKGRLCQDRCGRPKWQWLELPKMNGKWCHQVWEFDWSL